MRTFFRTAIVTLLLPLQAFAFTPDDALMRDYAGLTKALKANGIDPAFVNWYGIEPMCLGLKTERDQVSYNRCRFEKAGDWVAFNDNSRDCSTAGFYERPIATTHYQLSRGEVRRERNASYIGCMREFGWRNPSNWQHGRAYGMMQ